MADEIRHDVEQGILERVGKAADVVADALAEIERTFGEVHLLERRKEEEHERRIGSAEEALAVQKQRLEEAEAQLASVRRTASTPLVHTTSVHGLEREVEEQKKLKQAAKSDIEFFEQEKRGIEAKLNDFTRLREEQNQDLQRASRARRAAQAEAEAAMSAVANSNSSSTRLSDAQRERLEYLRSKHGTHVALNMRKSQPREAG